MQPVDLKAKKTDGRQQTPQVLSEVIQKQEKQTDGRCEKQLGVRKGQDVLWKSTSILNRHLKKYTSLALQNTEKCLTMCVCVYFSIYL